MLVSMHSFMLPSPIISFSAPVSFHSCVFVFLLFGSLFLVWGFVVFPLWGSCFSFRVRVCFVLGSIFFVYTNNDNPTKSEPPKTKHDNLQNETRTPTNEKTKPKQLTQTENHKTKNEIHKTTKRTMKVTTTKKQIKTNEEMKVIKRTMETKTTKKKSKKTKRWKS